VGTKFDSFTGASKGLHFRQFHEDETLARAFNRLCATHWVRCRSDLKTRKGNTDLKAKIDRQSAAVNYDLQAKCSKDARVWFNENWSRDKNTIYLDFTNHYNAEHNKCFILVEYHYKTLLLDASEWTNDVTLMDVYENAKYGEFAENHFTHFKTTITNTDEVITCEVQGTKCKTSDEFNHLVQPYMNN
jgi:hypothetical protein